MGKGSGKGGLDDGCIWILVVVGGCIAFVALLMILIMVPLHFSYVERQHLAFKKNTATQDVDQSKVYTNGRYAWGISYASVEFPSTYKRVDMTLSVFTDGGQTISVSFTFMYRIIASELSNLYRSFGKAYHDRVVSLARAELRNAGPQFVLSQYESQRANVSKGFFNLLAPNLRQKAFVEIKNETFFMQRIALPSTVLTQKTQIFLLNQFQVTQAYNLTSAQTRIETQQNVSTIDNEAVLVEKNATATADAMRASAKSQAFADIQQEIGVQLKNMIDKIGVSTDNSTERLLQYSSYLDATNKMTILSGVQSTVLKAP